MNDTHRSTPAFAVAGKVEGPTALHTQTTAPDAGKGQESVTLWQEVRDLENVRWGNDAVWTIARVLEMLERRGFTEHADAPAAGIGRDSGKFGAVASNGAEMGDDAPDTRKTPVWPEIDRSTPAGEARYQLTLSADVLIRHAHEAGPLTIADMIRCHNVMLEASSLIAELAEPTWKGIPLAETDALVLGIDGAVEDGATSGIADSARSILSETIDRVGAALERQGDAIRDHLSGDRTPEQLDRNPSRWTPAGAAWLEAGAPVGVAYAEYRGDAARVTHELGTVTRDTLDPAAAEQRATLERIAGTPRPSAVEIKVALETLADEAKGWEEVNRGWRATRLEGIATMLDRLGVEVLNLDLIVYDQQRQLARIAENAKPLDGLEVSRLVETARRSAEKLERSASGRAMAGVMHKLIAALNDQARQVAAKPRGTVVTSPRFYGEQQRERAARAFHGDALGASDYPFDKREDRYSNRTREWCFEVVDCVAAALGMRRAEA